MPNYAMIKTKNFQLKESQSVYRLIIIFPTVCSRKKNVIRSFLIPSFARYKVLQYIFLQKIISNSCLLYEKDIEKEMTLFLFKTICMCGLWMYSGS